ncbi:MAG TPA: translocation protein TolB, partial [Cyclobacteriaceae bacterium]|nr:translocation protein TolB [Cyclobacteriaceae bacterium]
MRDHSMKWMFRYVVVLGLMASALSGNAQHARETFGKNRIQYKQFEWQYLSSENFDIYYYDARRTVATEALNYLEGEFDRITDLIGYPPYLKTKIFLYNSISDLQQSNVGLNHSNVNTSGETNFVKPYVEIAHPGTLDEFKEELLFKMTELMINEMMFGGSLKDMFQSAVFMNLPEWFINGVSLYVAKGWNSEMDDFARQLVKSKKVSKALRFTGKDGALAGQSLWNFIVEKYGKSSVSNILNYTRVTRNEQISVKYTLGITFKQLIDEWEKFYLDSEQRVNRSYVSPSDSVKFSPRHNQKVVYTTVKLSPDGTKVAYAENDRGKYVVKVKSLENGKETTIINDGNRVIDQKVDYRMPLIGWSDANTLGVIAPKHGDYVFWLYDLNTRTKIPRDLDKFS